MADIKLATQSSVFNSLNSLGLPPNNEVLLDDNGNPSLMVKIPKFRISDVITGGPPTTHPAFIINGKEVDYIYISKYQNIVVDGRAYSLPYQNPGVNVTFDQAKTACETKGKGWHLMTNAEWAAIAIWCKKNDTQPFGCNDGQFGNFYNPWEKGAPITDQSVLENGSNEVLTGSGPKSWAHNNDMSGIFDLNGNVIEWVGGVRANAGEIQIIPNNDAAQAIDQSATSPLWKAILQNGSLVAPGTASTLKFKNSNLVISTTTANGSASGRFGSVTGDSGVTPPAILKALALFPADASNTYKDDQMYWLTLSERLCCRGGYYSYGAAAGVFFCNFINDRSFSGDYLGFRSAFVNL